MTDIAEMKKEVERLQKIIKEKENATIVDSFSKMFNRTSISTILKSEDGGESLIDREVCVGGWVRTARTMKGDDGKKLLFIDLNDGSCFSPLQVIVHEDIYDTKTLSTTGASMCVKGSLTRAPEDKQQKVELHVKEVLHHGAADGKSYPIAKGKNRDPKAALVHLRTITHLRPRTNVIAAVARIRHALAVATHKFFDDQGFLYVHAPLITQSDCEGAGEMFQMTTMLQDADPLPQTEVDALTKQLEDISLNVTAQGEVVKQVKADKRSKETIKKEVNKLLELKSTQEETNATLRGAGGIPRDADMKVDMTQDFFGKPSFATVSGQLHVENYACALSNVYTFGPTFRAEKSDTKKHLAEFWMIEPEIAYADITDNMNCAEAYIKYCCQYLLDNLMDDLQFLTKFHGGDTVARLKNTVENDFGRVEYGKAVELLIEAVEKKEVEFEFPVYWGVDLATEHESYLAATIFGKPVVVYNYPIEIKSFYMRLNEDNKTVAAMDILVPEVGELVGGSQREERLDVLLKRMKDCNLGDGTGYESYLDLRKYGTVPHSGFGVGFERLMMFTTRMDNIRDVIPFPRWYKHLAD